MTSRAEKNIRVDSLQADDAASRSRLYSFFSLSMTAPDEDFWETIKDREFRRDLETIREGLPYDLPGPLLPEAPEVPFVNFQSDFISVFDIGPQGPPCPLNEGANKKGSSRKSIMEDLVRFYNHFGMHMPDKIKELPDHLVTELEFMHYLCFLEAEALDKGEPVESYVLAQRDFLERHLAAWLPKLAASVSKRDEVPFYARMISRLDQFIQADLGYLNDEIIKES